MLALERAALAVQVLEFDLFFSAAEQDQVLDFLRQALERRLDIELGMPGQRLNQLKVIGVAAVPPANGAARQRQMRIGDDLLGIEELLSPQAVAGGAGADWTVEREQPRLQFTQRVVADRTGELVRKYEFGPRGIVHVRHPGHALAEAQRGFEGLGQALTQVGPHLEAIDDCFDRVLAAHIELRRLVQFDHRAVDPCAHEAAGLQFVDQFGVLTLALRDGRGEQHHRGALRML